MLARLALMLFGLSAAIVVPGIYRSDFRFCHITDTHVTVTRNVDDLSAFLTQVARQGEVSFVVNTGDVTELGTEEEFAAYLKAVAAASVPMYAVPGNHDVRWAPTGKEAFEKACGPRYRSFDFGGCHFVLLDSTVVLEHWGHLDGGQLKWLKRDLKRIRRGTPVFVFLHHWVGRDRLNIDNGAQLLEILAPHNVVAMFVGHGHADIQWDINGIRCFMARGLYQGSYHEVRVSSDTAEVVRVVTKEGTSLRETVAALPLHRSDRGSLLVEWNDPGGALLARRRFRTAFHQAGREQTDAAIRWFIDGRPGAGELRPGPDGWAEGSFYTDQLAPGWHVLKATCTRRTGETYLRELLFPVDRPDAGARMVWEANTGSSIQGSAVVKDGVVYFGSLDEGIYALQAETGKRRWGYRTGGAVYATPCVTDRLVIVGSTDHYVYALDRRSGRMVWRYDTGAPVLGSASAWEDTVCVGGLRAIHGIALADGTPRWRVPSGSFFQARPAVANGRFVLGGWDNTLYAINAAQGTVAWAAKMGRTNGGRGTLSFYYSPAIASPAVGEGRVYACTNDGVLHALSVADGTELWIARAPSGGDTFGYSSPLYHDGRVYLGGLGEKGQGDCYALDAASGRPIWRCSTGADNYDSSAALAGNAIVIGSVGGRVTWIERSTGRVAAAYHQRPGLSFSTAACDDRRAYLTSMNGTVTAVNHPASSRNSQ